MAFIQDDIKLDSEVSFGDRWNSVPAVKAREPQGRIRCDSGADSDSLDGRRKTGILNCAGFTA